MSVSERERERRNLNAGQLIDELREREKEVNQNISEVHERIHYYPKKVKERRVTFQRRGKYLCRMCGCLPLYR